MIKPIANEYLENVAQKLADAIKLEDREYYAHVMAMSEEIRRDLKRWELLAFRDRVHYLVDGEVKL